jgi:hypothetical protein
VLDELDIDWLIMSNTHEVEWGAALTNHLKIGGILGVVKSAEGSIFDTESILPEM